ncbi:MAG: OmpA family protein [Gammaproteobacteria bacterium]|nr:OmpA family protein [Gammaproteobacteria bacterium]
MGWVLLCTMLSVGCASSTGIRSDQNTDESNDAAVEALFEGKIDGLEFGSGDHNLTNASRKVLATLVENLKAHPEVIVALGGHTDNRGSAAANLELSKRRVMAVVKYLVVNGIDGRRLQPYGYGESRPIVSNATPDGRQMNRRIEMSIVKP